MVRVDTPHIALSEELFLRVVRENPELRLERSREGRLIVVPPTGGEGSRANAEITGQLRDWNRVSAGGVVFDSSGGFRLPNGATRSADAAWLPSSRWLQLDQTERQSFPPLCPEFVIELLSPSDDLTETRAKLDEFVQNGAQLGWLIGPLSRTVEIYRPHHAPELLKDPQTVQGEGVLLSFVLDLGPVFDDPTTA